MMNASTTSTRLHWSHALWRRIRSSMVIGAPSETVMVRQDLRNWQAKSAGQCVIFAVDRTTYLEPSHQRVQFAKSAVSGGRRRAQTRAEAAPRGRLVADVGASGFCRQAGRVAASP